MCDRAMIHRAINRAFSVLLLILANTAAANLVVVGPCNVDNSQRLALLIGAEEYALLGENKLRGPLPDVDLVANGLLARGFSATILTGQRATLSEVEATWRALTEKTRCGDHVVLMLSGNTFSDSSAKRWRFLFEDAQKNDRGTDVDSGQWSDDLLLDRIRKLRADGVHVTLILDADGAALAKFFDPPNRCCDVPPSFHQYSNMPDGGSLTLFASPQYSSEREFDVDGKKRTHGVFSYSLSKVIASTGPSIVREIQHKLSDVYYEMAREAGESCKPPFYYLRCQPHTATTHPDLPLFHTGAIDDVRMRGGPVPSTGDLPPASAEVLIDSSDGKMARSGARINGTLLTGQVKPADGLLALEIAGRRVPDVQPDGRFRVEVPLRRGDNDVEVAAMYTNRPHMVTRITVHSTGGQWLAERPANSYALLIANQKYDKASSGFGPLSTPKADAENLAKELRAGYGFRTSLPRNDGGERPLILYDANRADIFRALDDIARIATPEDVVLVFYAGHGEQLKSALPNGRTISRTYWVPTDSRAEDGDANWVSAQDIDTKIARIRARHVLVVSDSCFAGGLNRSGGGDITLQSAEPDRYLSEMSRKPSRYLLASGGNHPVDDGQGHSPFARALLNALRNPPAATFTLQQVFPALQKHVSNSTNQIPEFLPLRGDAGAAGDGGAMVFFANKL